MIQFHISQGAPEADMAAAELLAGWIRRREVKTLMVAGGNTPLQLYRLVAGLKPPVDELRVFVLDEYVGVPLAEPRNCTNLLRATVADAWGMPADRFHGLYSMPDRAEEVVVRHERLIESFGGLDAIVLGLGQNGHLGFNEPGSERESKARVISLEPISVEANRSWFNGIYGPSIGATVGLRTILGARRVLIQAYGERKVAPVRNMIRGPVGSHCPASFLGEHPETHLFLDHAAAAGVRHA